MPLFLFVWYGSVTISLVFILEGGDEVADIKVRTVEEADGQQIGEIYSFDSVVEQTSQLPYRNASHWQGFYASKSSDFMELVGQIDERVVGHLGLLLNQNPRRKHVASFGIAVHPKYQGKGVATALLREMLRLCDDWLNILKVELDVFCDNRGAVALYEKLGFVTEGTSRCDTFKGGSYCDSYRMARFHPKYLTLLQAGK